MWGIVDSMCDVSTDAAGGLDQRPESTKALIIVWIAKGLALRIRCGSVVGLLERVRRWTLSPRSQLERSTGMLS